jgi:8-oxo-dGTP diphosphatase
MFPIRVSVRALIERDGEVLLVKFDDEHGPHYNWPGGGIERGETVQEALVREVMEETCAEVVVGDLFCVFEYLPNSALELDVNPQTLSLIFHCSLAPEAQPCLPESPDAAEVAVEWMPIELLPDSWVLPDISPEVVRWRQGVNTGIPLVVARG